MSDELWTHSGRYAAKVSVQEHRHGMLDARHSNDVIHSGLFNVFSSFAFASRGDGMRI